MSDKYEITKNNDHYDVRINGELYCERNNMLQAVHEVEMVRRQKLKEEFCRDCQLYKAAKEH